MFCKEKQNSTKLKNKAIIIRLINNIALLSPFVFIFVSRMKKTQYCLF